MIDAAIEELRAAVLEAAEVEWPAGSPEEKFVRGMEEALAAYDAEGAEPEPTLVYCVWCHKTHAAMPGEKSCGVEGTWRVESTGLRWRS